MRGGGTMRELKFRAWNKFDKEFAHNIDCLLDMSVAERVFVLDDEGGELIIEQYTGLKDKNGKEIYEGDIVKYNTVYEGSTRRGRGVVNFGELDDTEGWDNLSYLCWRIGDWLSLNDPTVEVIGNIHENPELLEGRE
jgi:uncharacterized phage protein (TIGR01671 family)